MSKKYVLFIILFTVNNIAFAQNELSFFEKSNTLHKKRRNAVIITESALTASALIALNELWYADYPRSNFHFINDNKDWKKMDKIGHVMTSYYVGNLGKNVLDWAGIHEKNQLIYGATLGFSFLTAVEIFDGFSKQWGASFGDILANATGTGIYIGQELLWKEQRIKFKFSFHQTKYATQRPSVLGENFTQQIIKDYNGQTYWISLNIWSFNKKNTFPKWLNVAFGYGAEGMLYSNGNSNLQNPYAQYYLSLDIDLTRIETESTFLKTLFSVINFIKIPAPAIELSKNGKLKFHYLYF